jgi:hypothetical protein
MKKCSLFVLCMAIVTAIFPQYPNWGWGPAITVSQNGSTLTCSAYDPFLNLTRTTTVTNVDIYQNDDGILAYVTLGGTVGGVTYDINQGSWKTNTFSSNNGNTIQNADGVIAWVSAAGTVGGAVYDPAQEAWEYTTFSSNNGNTIQNADGVIAWVSSAGTVGGAVYHPGQQVWKYTTFSSNNGNTLLNEDGVIAWVSSAGTVGGAVYDPAQEVWEYTTFSSNAGNSIVNENGVIGFISSAGTVGGGVYDPNQQVWEYTTFSSSASNTNLSVSDGTIYWTNSNGSQHQGYSFSSQNWQSNQNTQLHCTMFVENATGNTPLISYFWCLTVGANSYSYDSDAGHTITRRWGFKQYDNAGSYTPELTIFNSMTNTTCDANVTVSGGTGIGEETQVQAHIYPNPVNRAGQLEIQAPKPILSVELTDLMGTKLLISNGKGNRMTLDLGDLQLAAGVYFVEVRMTGAESLRRKIVVE